MSKSLYSPCDEKHHSGHKDAPCIHKTLPQILASLEWEEINKVWERNALSKKIRNWKFMWKIGKLFQRLYALGKMILAPKVTQLVIFQWRRWKKYISMTWTKAGTEKENLWSTLLLYACITYVQVRTHAFRCSSWLRLLIPKTLDHLVCSLVEMVII